MQVKAAMIATALLLFAAGAPAQTRPTGDVSITSDYVPHRGDTAELRMRLFAEEVFEPNPSMVIKVAGFAEGLIARRPVAPEVRTLAGTGSHGSVTDLIAHVYEATVALKRERVDLYAGIGRAVWGRLDELQPTDVINPLDVSRFFFEGRSAARLPVPLVRARWFAGKTASIEAVYVPFFRRGRFDQLDEPSSPFNIAAAAAATGTPVPLRVEAETPAATLGNAQGGLRIGATARRIDWSVSMYRGFEPFGLFASEGAAAGFIPVAERFPRFTMIGGDFETVRGRWGLRGEVAGFVHDNFQDPALRVVRGASIDAGAGVDRDAGSYHFGGTVLLHHETYDGQIATPDGLADGRTGVSLIVSTDRTFARERYRTRVFGVYDPSEGSAFLRGIGTMQVRTDVSIEGSIGWFAGEGRDLIGRFGDSDFAYVRLKVHF